VNRFAFILLAWVLLGLELGLKSALELGDTGIAPSFVVPLGIFIALGAPPTRAVWFCIVLGVLMDLTSSAPVVAGGAGGSTIVGPWALGMALAAQLVLALRGMMIRTQPLTMGFLSALGMGVAQIVIVAILTAHNLFHGDLAWRAGAELGHRLGSAAYTGVMGFVMALVLVPMAPMVGLQLGQRTMGRR
jgi:hypothetical protein